MTLNDADLAERFRAAADAAREAGEVAERLIAGSASELGVSEKGALDVCTEADRAVERLLGQRLADRFGDAILGEEYGGTLGDRLWVVDPIDGTYNFVHGLPQWCISIGFVVARVPTLGVVYNPVRQEMFAARLGRGASLNGAPIRVSGARHVERPLVEVGWSNRRPIADFQALVGRLIAAGFEFRRLGSGALGMAQVAAGRTDAYVEQHINAWDVAAGLVLVREAGGRTNDFMAGDGLSRGNPILASTPALWDRLSEIAGIA
jgi:myo-inositol-1(or 4)-monophosphatase